MPANVFVLGLDEHNEKTLRDLPDAAEFRIHSLLTIDELPPEIADAGGQCCIAEEDESGSASSPTRTAIATSTRTSTSLQPTRTNFERSSIAASRH